MKKCSVCDQTKPLVDFHRRADARDGKTSQCKSCRCGETQRYKNSNREAIQDQARRYYVENKEKHQAGVLRQRQKKPAAFMVNSAKWRAKKLGLAFDLDRHVEAIQHRIDTGICELTGVALSRKASGRCFDAPSLDRIVPELGYVYTNIRVVCLMVNCAIGPWGESSLRAVMQAWHKKEAGQATAVPPLAGWPTPMAGSPATEDYNEAGNTDSSRKTVALVGWAAPRTADADKGVRSDEGAIKKNMRTRGPDLCTMAKLSGWASPAARDWKNGQASDATMARNARPLNEQATMLASGPTPPSSPAPMEKRGALNPAFSRWLMGYPEGWCQAAIRAHRKRIRARKGASAGSADMETR